MTRPRPADQVGDLIVDLAATPLAALVPADLLPALCTDAAEALSAVGVAVILRRDDGLVAAGWSDARAEDLVRLQVALGQGPGVRSIAERRTVLARDLTTLEPEPCTLLALALQVRRAVAAPLRHGDEVCGALEVFLTDRQPVTPELVAGAEAVGRVLGALTGDAELYRRSTELAVHLTEVLAQRAPVEQAKGVLAERHRIGLREAFGVLRSHARRRRVSVTEVAREVVSGRATEVVEPVAERRAPPESTAS